MRDGRLKELFLLREWLWRQPGALRTAAAEPRGSPGPVPGEDTLKTWEKDVLA